MERRLLVGAERENFEHLEPLDRIKRIFVGKNGFLGGFFIRI
jgi:hypothetical protein